MAQDIRLPLEPGQDRDPRIAQGKPTEDKIPQAIRVKTASGVKTFPAGTPVAIVLRETGASGIAPQSFDLTQAFENPAEGLPERPGMSEANQGIVSGIGDTLALAGGFIPQAKLGKALIGMLTSAFGGAVSAGARGEDPLMAAISEAGLTGLGAGAAEKIPRAGLRTGMAIGGVKGDTKGATDAFMRERRRAIPKGTPVKHRVMGKGVPLGARERIDTRIGNVSKELEKVERANPKTQPFGVLTDAGDKITDRAKDTEFPISLRGKVNENEIKFTLEQLAERTGIPLHRLERGQIQPRTKLDVDSAARALPGEVPKTIEDLIWSTPVDVRDLGNFKRNQAHKAKDVIRARLGGELVPDDVATAGQISANRAQRAKVAQEDIAPEVTPINERLSDLFTMKETDDALRGGGGVLGDLGQMGMRGGLGAGLGGNIASITGQNNLNYLAGPLAMVGLSPSNISRIGFAGGRVGGAIPTAWRSADLLDRIFGQDDEDEEDTPPVRRREPGR